MHQGTVLAPLLSNLYLDAFDRSMLAAGYRVIRYSDDFAIPVADRAAAERALADAAETLSDLRLDLGPAKSMVVSFDAGVPFLGATVTSTTSPGAEALSHPLEAVVYVDRPGSLIRSRGDRIVVEYQDQVLLRLNLRRVRQVVCIGRVGMTTPFLHRALAQTDPTARRAQYRMADDVPASRELARAFVDGKIVNMRVALLRASRRAPDPARKDIAETLALTRLLLPDAESIEEIMGHEGMASREYFRAWRELLGGDWGFTSRQRRPPPDPANAMLSFGYTLLTAEAVAALAAAGLDPAVGFLHQARWGRPDLTLDIMEEFRPLVVDAVVMRCATTGIVRPEEFETVPDQGCRMNPRARHAFLAAYEHRMLTLFAHEPSGRRVSYRVGLGLQARALARSILKPDVPYRPVRWK
ncbi:MAG TPA: CRISPR-associated endonuclease Cas1 [Streptosporangiaceae bacterium]|nr:CRISPR-associated endonuclease Cas1 [Streptosporangiaceae bacterium]